MRRVMLLTVLLAGAVAAPAAAAPWNLPKPLLAGARAAGLEPQGRPDAYVATSLGQDSAHAFELPAGGAPKDLELFPRPSSTVVLASGPAKTLVMAAENGGGTLLAYRRGPDGTDQASLSLWRARSAAVGEDGTVAVADVADVAVARPREPFASPQGPPDPETAVAGDVAAAPDGTVYLLVAANGRLTLYERDADGRLGSSELASYRASAGGAVRSVALAAGRDGALAAVWAQRDGGARTVLLGRTRPAGGRFGVVQRLDASRRANLEPQVALLGDDRAVAAWVAAHDRHGRVPPRLLYSAFSAPGPGAFGPGLAVSSFGRVAGRRRAAVVGRDARGPDLVSGAGGTAALAWAAACGGCDTKVLVSTASRRERFGRPTVVSRLGTLSDGPQVALDGAGGGAVAWSQRTPITRADTAAVFSRTLRIPPPPRADRRPPGVWLRPLASIRRALGRGTLPVRAHCDEPCAVQLEIAGGSALVPDLGAARLAIAPGAAGRIRRDLHRRHRTELHFVASDRAGNTRRGTLALRD